MSNVVANFNKLKVTAYNKNEKKEKIKEKMKWHRKAVFWIEYLDSILDVIRS